MNRWLHKILSRKGITFFYFFLFVYTIAALLWWGYMLFEQSHEITRFEKMALELRINPEKHPVAYEIGIKQVENREKMRSWKYWGEGLTFLLVILTGAAFVYQAVRNQMKLSQQQHNFMMAVTHELKSPIAVARLNLETLQKRKLDTEQQQKLIGNTLRETNRLNHLCNNMLLASQFESRQYQLVKEPLDFSGLLRQCLNDARERIHTHQITDDIVPEVWLRGDPLLLQIAVNNLVENASKYSPPDTVIHVSLMQDQQYVVLRVSDEGIGIAPEERQKIFAKFYRIGNENTRKTKGTGLGLFLTMKIIQQHGGTIRVMDHERKGSIFEITLPRGKHDQHI